MFSRRPSTALLLLAGYALPALVGRGLHGDDHCVPCRLSAGVESHEHRGCGHEHAASPDAEGGVRIERGARHELASHGDCDLCVYLAQAQCAADPAAPTPEPRPVSAARIARPSRPTAVPAGLHLARGPPASISA